MDNDRDHVLAIVTAMDEYQARVLRTARDRLAEHGLPHATSPVNDHLTVSIGIAVGCSERHATPQELVNEADRALYRAKEQGRDRIVVATSQDATDDPGAQLTLGAASIALR